MEQKNKFLIVEAVSNTASFRIPEFHNYHKTLPLPPVTTVIGIVGAALGKNYEEAQKYFEISEFEIGIYGKSQGFMRDLWKAKKWKGSKPKKSERTIIQREYHFDNHFVFVFGNTENVINELKNGFEETVFALTIGNSDSLLKIAFMDIMNGEDVFETNHFSHCLLLGNYIDDLKLDFENIESGKKYIFKSVNSPVAYNLPNSFIFGKGEVRKVKERREYTFIKDQVKAALKGAFRLGAQQGMARLEKQAQWLEQEYPSAAASLREGLEELFTVNRIGLSPSLRRCLTTTNIIESPHSGVRKRTSRVSRWRDSKMVLRWAAAAFLDAESHFHRIMGYRDLWQLKAYLDNIDKEGHIDKEKRVA